MVNKKTELVVKISGEVAESNFEQFKVEAIAMIEGQNKSLVTDNDFAEAEQVIKDCEVAEKALKDAKAEALASTADVDKLFSAMDEVGVVLVATRLSLTKGVKKEKNKRKQKVIDDVCAAFQGEIDKVAEHTPEILLIVSVHRAGFEAAVKGRRKKEAMLESTNLLLAEETERLHVAAKTAKRIVTMVGEANELYGGLFLETKTLVVMSVVEVESVIRARIAEFELANKQREEERKKWEKEKPKVAAEQGFKKEPAIEPRQKLEQGSACKVEPDVVTDNNFILTAHIECGQARAKEVASMVSAYVDNIDEIKRVRLQRG